MNTNTNNQLQEINTVFDNWAKHNYKETVGKEKFLDAILFHDTELHATEISNIVGTLSVNDVHLDQSLVGLAQAAGKEAALYVKAGRALGYGPKVEVVRLSLAERDGNYQVGWIGVLTNK